MHRLTWILLGLMGAAAFSTRSAATQWYLDASAGAGLADQMWTARADGREFEIDFESLSVWRYSIGAGAVLPSGFEIGPEVAWSQRGGALIEDLGVFRPGRTRRFDFERTYLDISLNVRRVWHLGNVLFSAGVAPRISRLLDEEAVFYSAARAEDWIFGVDPELRFAYAFGYLWASYRWDLESSYRAGESEMEDRAGYAGVGVRLF